jgi:hypothetical protein
MVGAYKYTHIFSLSLVLFKKEAVTSFQAEQTIALPPYKEI